MEKIIFLRTAWMAHYKGVTKSDIPKGAGSYVSKNKTGGEVENFKSFGGKFYGYCRNAKGRNFNINRIGAEDGAAFMDDVTVILFATNPVTGGQFVVGWYLNARLYRAYQKKKIGGTERMFICETKSTNGNVIPVAKRIFKMPNSSDGGPGQTNLWYIDNYSKSRSFLKALTNYIEDPDAYYVSKMDKSPRQPDVKKRLEVEWAAMEATMKYWELRGYHTADVSKKNYGWDIEAKLEDGAKRLLLEVKGLSGDLNSLELTPNEYKQSKRANFRLCVLPNALDVQNELLVFEYNKKEKYWISDSDTTLKVKEIMSARLIKV